jgi:hypothetical protein
MSARIIVPEALLAPLRAAARATRHEPPTEQVLSSPGELCPSRDVERFHAALIAELSRHGYAVIGGFDPQTRFITTALIADVLGGASGTAAGPLGGEVTTVVTSSVFDHNLAWHTDSTSWEEPNRWQVLSLVRPDDRGRPAPTSVLRWDDILDTLPTETVEVLKTDTYGWREQFAELPPLVAPILGSAPRWLRPALARHLEGQDGTAIATLASTIASAEQSAELELTESCILVFDNHAVLHRGPHLDPDGGRTIVRMKLGGRVGDLVWATASG